MAAEQTACVLIRMALAEAGMTQSDLARSMGLTQKHISRMLTGHAGISLYLLESILSRCGMRLVLTYTPRKSGRRDGCR